MNSRNSHQKNTIKLVWHSCGNTWKHHFPLCGRLKKVWRPWSAGTSLPDTFASKTAAQQDPHVGSPEVRLSWPTDRLAGWHGCWLGHFSVDLLMWKLQNRLHLELESSWYPQSSPMDNSPILRLFGPPVINRRPSFAETTPAQADASVGNVTGSNSVNVFLGLGMSTSQITGAVVRWRNPGELAVSQPWTTVDGRWFPWIFESDSEDFSRWVILWLFYGYTMVILWLS